MTDLVCLIHEPCEPGPRARLSSSVRASTPISYLLSPTSRTPRTLRTRHHLDVGKAQLQHPIGRESEGCVDPPHVRPLLGKAAQRNANRPPLTGRKLAE